MIPFSMITFTFIFILFESIKKFVTRFYLEFLRQDQVGRKPCDAVYCFEGHFLQSDAYYLFSQESRQKQIMREIESKKLAYY